MKKNILLCVSGGIAVYKACTLVRQLKQKNFDVNVIMTEHATQFVAPLTFGTLAESKVVVDMFAEHNYSYVQHITLAKQADAVVVYPATANIIAKLSHGIADDMASTTILASTCPVVICPAMNTNMYNNPATLSNIDTLKSRGINIVEGDSGFLACGDVGKGRAVEPEILAQYVENLLACSTGALQGKKVLLTVGATAEKLDDVRIITNHSSGKMGFELAKCAQSMGADVTVILGSHTAPVPQGLKIVNVSTTQQMLNAVMDRVKDNDIFVMCAAPADYKPCSVSPTKLSADKITIEFTKNPDIAQAVGKKKGKKLLVVFSAETDNGVEKAKQKLIKKNADFAVLNMVKDGAVFGADDNTITIVQQDGTEEYPTMSKAQVAKVILDKVVSLL